MTHEALAHTAAATQRLPDELWARISAHLDYAELASLSCCSRQLRRLGNAPSLWRALCEARGFALGRAGRGGGAAAVQPTWKACFRDGCGSLFARARNALPFC